VGGASDQRARADQQLGEDRDRVGLRMVATRPPRHRPWRSDKRLLVVEPEFASVLKAASRDVSTLSPTLRNAWDGRPLQLLTRTAPARSTDAHVSIVGHITALELRRHATTNEIADGFLNRFILLAVRRIRLLPEGGDPDPLKHTGLRDYFAKTVEHARSAGPVKLDERARQLWRAVYPALSEPGTSLAGQLAARVEAHTIRLALLYALLDGRRQIGDQHLKAALGTVGLRPALRELGTRPSDRRPARRTDPRRAKALARRTHPHPTARPATAQLPRRADRASTPRTHRLRPRRAHAHPHRRTTRRAVDRRLRPRRAHAHPHRRLTRSDQAGRDAPRLTSDDRRRGNSNPASTRPPEATRHPCTAADSERPHILAPPSPSRSTPRAIPNARTKSPGTPSYRSRSYSHPFVVRSFPTLQASSRNRHAELR